MVLDPEIAMIRLGYGLSPDSPQAVDADLLLASVATARPDADAIRMADIDARRQVENDLAAAARKPGSDKPTQRKSARMRRETIWMAQHAFQVRVARAVADPVGFGERLVQFWSDHFTVAGGNRFQSLIAAAHVDEAIRPHLGGRFSDLMFAAETHPRMLTYLNQSGSVGPNSAIARRRKDDDLGLNENLAREMIELHSLGVGGDYTQRDVRQLARLLTGLSYRSGQDRAFRPAMAEPGADTVLGVTYGGNGQASLNDIRAVIEDLAMHPDTARHLARKLAVHFVSDDPPADLIDRLAQTYRQADGDLSAVYVALAEAPELAAGFRQKARQPFDFVVAALRALGMRGGDLRQLDRRDSNGRLLRPLQTMGQRWAMPRGPDGWPESAESWITPQGLAARIDWSMRHPAKLLGDLPDPRDFLRTALGSTASQSLQWAVPKAESPREGVAIVLASADFNRR